MGAGKIKTLYLVTKTPREIGSVIKGSRTLYDREDAAGVADVCWIDGAYECEVKNKDVKYDKPAYFANGVVINYIVSKFKVIKWVSLAEL